MKYLGLIKGKPDPKTGVMTVVVPSLSNQEQREAYPKKFFIGLRQPYKLDDVIVVEDIEGRLYYSDRVPAFTQYPAPSFPFDENAEDVYAFVNPFGYIAWTKDNVYLAHHTGNAYVVLPNTAKSLEVVTAKP